MRFTLSACVAAALVTAPALVPPLAPAFAADAILDLAVAAALAEDEARRSRVPTVAADAHASEGWLRQARLEGLQ